MTTHKTRVWPIGRGAFAASLGSLLAFGCGDSDDANAPNPIMTTPGPDQPGAGLGTERPDPCRGVPLPADQHFVAPGLCASAVALGQDGLRQITFASNGDLIGVRSSGEVMRYRDANDDGMFDGAAEISLLGSTGGNGNNAHLDEPSGFLYAGSPDGVVRWPYTAATTTLGTPEPVVVNQPSNGTHTYHTVHVYDGWLYVHSGSEDNMVAPAAPEIDTNRAVLKRFELAGLAPAGFDWTAGELVASGLRNMVGYTEGPDGNLFGVVNGIDNLSYQGADVHLDNPGEVLISIEPGQSFGYPYCFTAQNVTTAAGVVAPGTQLASEAPGFTNPHDDAWCQQNSEQPVSFLPAHSAPLDITFYGDTAGEEAMRSLPEDWVGGAFVSQHGSWNTMPSVGHNVVFFPLGSDQPMMPESAQTPPSFPFTVVFGGGSSAGHVDGQWSWSSGGQGEDPVRPVGVAVSPVDGALYISSDGEGALYRVGVPL